MAQVIKLAKFIRSKCERTQKLNLGTGPGAVSTSRQRAKLDKNSFSFQSLKIQKTKQRMMSK